MPRESKTSLLCLLVTGALIVLPLSVFVAAGWYWLARFQDLGDEIDRSIDQLHRYQRVIQTLPALTAELERVKSNEEIKSFYFDAPTPALAGAQLQRRVQEIVQAAGGRLISTQLLPSAQGEDPPRVRIRTQLQGTTGALLDVLLEIEQARPFLFVDQASVRSTARRQRPSARRSVRRVAAGQQEGLLTVRLDVFGYALGEAK